MVEITLWGVDWGERGGDKACMYPYNASHTHIFFFGLKYLKKKKKKSIYIYNLRILRLGGIYRYATRWQNAINQSFEAKGRLVARKKKPFSFFSFLF